MLKLLADENIPRRLVSILRRLGIDVIRIADAVGRGRSDLEVIEVSNNLGRVIVTRDSDYTLPWMLSRAGSGVIYIAYNPDKQELEKLARALARIASTATPKRGLLIVVYPGGVVEVQSP